MAGFWFFFLVGGREGFIHFWKCFWCLFREAHLSRLSTAFLDTVGRQHTSTGCLKKWHILIFVHSSCNAAGGKKWKLYTLFPDSIK